MIKHQCSSRWQIISTVLIGFLSIVSTGFAEPIDMAVTWENPNPTPQTENLTRTKGDADTWQFNVILQGVRFVGEPTWSYGPKGDDQNWGTWDEAENSVSWIAPPEGLQEVGSFYVSVTGDIVRIGPGTGPGEIKRMNASWSGNVFGIIIRHNDIDITDQTVDVIVGQRISLTTEITAAPAGKMLTATQWSIPGAGAPGEPVKDYRPSLSEGKIVKLTAEDKTQDHIAFYFIAGDFSGTSTDISYSVVIDGIPSIAKTTFKVFRPKATFTSRTSKDKNPVDIRLRMGPEK